MFRFGDPGGRAYGTLGTSNVNILAWWSTANVVGALQGNLSIVSGGGRNIGSCLRFANASNTGTSLTKSFDSQATWGVAFVFKISGFYSTTQIITIFSDSNNTQVDLRLNIDGSLSVTRAGTSLGSTSAGLITVGSWNHIELKVTINNTTGSVALYFNGINKLNLTSQNTRATSNNSANQLTLGNATISTGGGNNFDFDDIIVYDGQANDAQGNPDIVGPIGDCALAWLLPTGAGTTTQFTPDSGANYARVNEATPDGDTSYVADATVNDIDTYALADLGGTVATVKSIMTAHFAKKDDTGTRTFVSEIRTASTNFAGSTINGLSSSYQYYFNNWGSNPSSLIDWTVSDINGLEIGQKVNS